MRHEAATLERTAWAKARWSGVATAAYPVVSTLVGVLLLAAALLKLTGGTADSLGQNAALFSPAARMATIQAELLLGLWLLCRWRARAARRAALAFFAAMAAVSLWLALQGQSTCGCFGRITIHPWATLGLDLVVVAAFTLAKPSETEPESELLPSGVLKAATGAAVLLSASALGLMAFWQTDLDDMVSRLRGEPLSIYPAVYELGEGAQGDGREFEVVMRNHSGRKVRLVGGSSSCSCAATASLPLDVPAGGEATIRVRAKFAGTAGRFQHEFVVYTSERKQTELRARFSGTVVEP